MAGGAILLSREECGAAQGKKIASSHCGTRPASAASASRRLIRHQQAARSGGGSKRQREPRLRTVAAKKKHRQQRLRTSALSSARSKRMAARKLLHRFVCAGRGPRGSRRGGGGASDPRPALQERCDQRIGRLERPRRSSGGTTASAASSFAMRPSQIYFRRADIGMTEPERDFSDVTRRLQHYHRAAVAQLVRRDRTPVEGRAGFGRGAGMLIHRYSKPARHRLSFGIDEESGARSSPARQAKPSNRPGFPSTAAATFFAALAMDQNARRPAEGSFPVAPRPVPRLASPPRSTDAASPDRGIQARREIWRIQDGADFLHRQVGDELLIVPLGGDGADLSDCSRADGNGIRHSA